MHSVCAPQEVAVAGLRRAAIALIGGAVFGWFALAGNRFSIENLKPKAEEVSSALGRQNVVEAAGKLRELETAATSAQLGWISPEGEALVKAKRTELGEYVTRNYGKLTSAERESLIAIETSFAGPFGQYSRFVSIKLENENVKLTLARGPESAAVAPHRAAHPGGILLPPQAAGMPETPMGAVLPQNGAAPVEKPADVEFKPAAAIQPRTQTDAEAIARFVLDAHPNIAAVTIDWISDGDSSAIATVTVNRESK